MPYLIFIKGGGAHTPGPQLQTVSESQKVQATPAVTALNAYGSPFAQTSTLTETQKAQATPAVTALNYA